MNFFGIDILQLIVYGCVFACVIIVVYILKLQRSKTKTLAKPMEEESTEYLKSDAITMELIDFLREMWRHQVGLDSHSCIDTTLPPPPLPLEPQTPEPETPTPTENKLELEPQKKKPAARLSKVNEENYVPTEEDNQLLERLRERLKEKE